MVIRTNIAALQLQRNWQQHTTQVGKAIERLSSGFKINRAADDASGLAISQKMKLQLDLLREEQSSAQRKISLYQTEDGYLDQLQEVLLRMGELAGRAANGTLSDFDRLLLDNEYQQLLGDLNRYPDQSMKLRSLFSEQSQTQTEVETRVVVLDDLDGFLGGLDSFLTVASAAIRSGDGDALLSLGIPTEEGLSQSAALRDAVIRYTNENAANFAADSQDPKSSGAVRWELAISGNNITVQAQMADFDWLDLAGTHIRDAESAGKAMDAIHGAANRLSSCRGSVGATLNLLERTMNRLSAMEEDLMAAISRITDADMAEEMMNLVKAQVLEQVTALLSAQANRKPETVLRLLDVSITV